ncbi:MAG: DUF385 domain-containing protein [Acidobacteria bacterium]|nr:MAG: DUF385 domain-containing protein [Acidobacteriota bacterium]TDI15996.1 MAG: DUF385 domain-containing protein [Acidobacteriota bacterium]
MTTPVGIPPGASFHNPPAPGFSLSHRGGAPSHPAWYLNLTAHPEVEVQVEAERSTLWDQMVGIFSPYADYQKRTEREIPVVILEPLGD